MIFPADGDGADAEEKDPAGDAHAPERAVNGNHASEFDGDFFSLDDKRAAD